MSPRLDRAPHRASRRTRRGAPSSSLGLAALGLCFGLVAAAPPALAIFDEPIHELLDRPTEQILDPPHDTPLAGETHEAEILGEEVAVEPRNRDTVAAVSVGSTLYLPEVGDTRFSPLASFYYFRDFREYRMRAQVSGLVNDVELATRSPSADTSGGVEGILRLHNDQSRLFGHAEVVDGRELAESEVAWGDAAVWSGAGWSAPIAPFRVENDLRVQLFYRLGLEHFHETFDGEGAVDVPEDTLVHGPWLRLRLDGIQRNLLEIPHVGYAFGLDLEATRRDRWSETRAAAGAAFDPVRDRGDRDYAKLSGYAVAVGGLPFLSERHRGQVQLDLGWSPSELDRYSAFRIGGGPLPKESADLNRSTYPGALFGQLVSDRYALASVEYRLELMFFLYLHLRASYFHGHVADAERDGAIRYDTVSGDSYSAAITTGFPWDSVLYLEYDYETGLARGGEDGHQLLLLWSKQL